MTSSAPVGANEGIHELAAYGAGLQASDIPSQVLEHASVLLADAAGCGLLGSTLPWSQALTGALAHAEPEGSALAWGTDERFGPTVAALVNGTAVHGFELDDVGAGQHNGSVAFPAAIAVAEGGLGATSGEELLVSFVAGCEVVARIQDAIGRRPHVEVGFHGPGLMGVFSAAVAAGRMLRLAPEEMVSAVAHAGQQASGLMATHHGGMGKRLLQGRAAQSGTLGAIIAADGFTNTADTLTGTYGGFFSTFSGGTADIDWSKLTAGLGERWATLESLVKMWACRVPIHPTLEAIATLRERGLRGDDVQRVDVSLDAGSYRAVGGEAVSNSPASAQLNLAYCAAVALLDGEVFIDQFTPERLADPDVLDLAHRVHTNHDSSLDEGELFRRRSQVTVALRSGRTLEALGVQRGQPDNPMRPSDVEQKFQRMCEVAGCADRAQSVWQAARSITGCADVREFTSLLQRR